MRAKGSSKSGLIILKYASCLPGLSPRKSASWRVEASAQSGEESASRLPLLSVGRPAGAARGPVSFQRLRLSPGPGAGLRPPASAAAGLASRRAVTGSRAGQRRAALTQGGAPARPVPTKNPKQETSSLDPSRPGLCHRSPCPRRWGGGPEAEVSTPPALAPARAQRAHRSWPGRPAGSTG